jgi:hypothetical protein
MKFLHVHWEGRMEVFLNTDDSPAFPYEAQITNDGTQRRGWGNTPRAAIIDAISEHRDDNEGDYFVGVNPVEGEGSGVPLRRFHTKSAAVEWIDTLIGAEHGLYYLDGPEE